MVPKISAWKRSGRITECWGNLQGVLGKHHGWWAELYGLSLWVRVGLGFRRWLWGDPRLPVQCSAQAPGFSHLSSGTWSQLGKRKWIFYHQLCEKQQGSSLYLEMILSSLCPATESLFLRRRCSPGKPRLWWGRRLGLYPRDGRRTLMDVFSGCSPPSELGRKTEAWASQR